MNKELINKIQKISWVTSVVFQVIALAMGAVSAVLGYLEPLYDGTAATGIMPSAGSICLLIALILLFKGHKEKYKKIIGTIVLNVFAILFFVFNIFVWGYLSFEIGLGAMGAAGVSTILCAVYLISYIDFKKLISDIKGFLNGTGEKKEKQVITTANAPETVSLFKTLNDCAEILGQLKMLYEIGVINESQFISGKYKILKKYNICDKTYTPKSTVAVEPPKPFLPPIDGEYVFKTSSIIIADKKFEIKMNGTTIKQGEVNDNLPGKIAFRTLDGKVMMMTREGENLVTANGVVYKKL